MKPKPRQFLSDQEFFTAAWHWLITENHPRCANPLGAVYRDGNMTCVMGAFIPDELYELRFPDEPITVLLDAYPEFRDWFRHLTPELMLAVEEVHNCPDESLATRRKKMRVIAVGWMLGVPT
jgi:hypothetical protein